jgi:hypothetical protein
LKFLSKLEQVLLKLKAIDSNEKLELLWVKDDYE